MGQLQVAIVGAGIVGLATGWQLARRDVAVTIIERGEIAREASWAAAGMLAPLAETVEAGAARDFGLLSLSLYPQFLAELVEDAGSDAPAMDGPGLLRLAFDRRALAALTLTAESIAKSGHPAEILGRAELHALEPLIARDALGALHSPDERHIDPRRLCAALACAARKRGVLLIANCAVHSLESRDRLTVVHDRGESAVDRAIVAAGAWSAALLAPFGVHLPIFPRKGQMIALRTAAPLRLTHTIYSHHTYLVPRAGRIIVGATEEDAGFNRSIRAAAEQHLREGAERLAPALANAQIDESWMGFRPATADGLPIIGPLPGEPRIYVASGHRRNGILLAPGTAMRVADEICGAPFPGFDEFRPRRFTAPSVRRRGNRPVVLAIAGSDPSGGAGIQTDQRTIEAMGCAAMTVPTALTSQNSLGVASIWPTPIFVVASQLETLLADTKPDAVKIGLLPSAEHVETVADILRAHGLSNIVLDPVIAPTYGQPFLHADGIERLLRDLAPLCTVVTPNADEAVWLTGCDIESVSDMEAAGRALLRAGAEFALIKGGHLAHVAGEPARDILVGRGDVQRVLSAPFEETVHTHGTGCLLSSAIAARLALGESVISAAQGGKRDLSQALATPVVVGKGRGYPAMSAFGAGTRIGSAHAERIARLRGIYFVTPDSAECDTLALVRCALAGGVRVVQLRAKTLPAAALAALGREVREETRRRGALLIINDRVDIALACDADGVHLGPDDLDPVSARKALGPDRLIGISAGSVEELDDYGPGRQAASYIGCGPVFATRTKTDAGAAIGLKGVAAMRRIAPEMPIVAIGGVDERSVADICAAGARCAAAVSAISGAPSPDLAARRLCDIWVTAIARTDEPPAG